MLTKIALIVISGPSGCGKSTLLKRLFQEYPQKFGFSVSHTTRSPRPGEANGQHYHFTQREEMLEDISQGDFIEFNEFAGNLYGTSKAAVKTVFGQGKQCILDIDLNGVRSVKKSNYPAKFLFIRPPSPALEVLESRLRERGTETESSLEKRLNTAAIELKAAVEEEGLHDLVIINDDLDVAYAGLKGFIIGDGE